MRKLLFTAITIFALAITCYSQNDNWNKWEWLLGEWRGEGSGQPGQGDGSFIFAFELDKNIIIRKSSTEFPATDDRQRFVHEDLMIVYLDYSGNLSKAIYFDNEGHTINYTISYFDKTITFVSERMPNIPIFRLTYALLDNNTINTKFEMSQDGENFMIYIEGKSKKVK